MRYREREGEREREREGRREGGKGGCFKTHYSLECTNISKSQLIRDLLVTHRNKVHFYM